MTPSNYAHLEKLYLSIDPTCLKTHKPPAHAVISKDILLPVFYFYSLRCQGAMCPLLEVKQPPTFHLFGPPAALDRTSIVTEPFWLQS